MDKIALPGFIVPLTKEDCADMDALCAKLFASGVQVIEWQDMSPGEAAAATRRVHGACPGILCGYCGHTEAAEKGDREELDYLSPDRLPIPMPEEGKVFPLCLTAEEAAKAKAAGYAVVRMQAEDAESALRLMKELLTAVPEVRVLLSGPFDDEDIGRLIREPVVYAVCSSLIPLTAERIEARRRAVLGFAFAHMGINNADLPACERNAKLFADVFGFNFRDNGNSLYASEQVEFMKFMQLGTHGHIAIRTNSAERALIWLESRGFTGLPATARYRDGRLVNIYFKEEVAGFALHLLQPK